MKKCASDGRALSVYVGDDASPEPVGEIVQSFGPGADKLLYHRFTENLGGTSLVRQWERCIRLSNEPWIWLFSDDDMMDSGCVAAFYRELETAGEAFDLCRFNNRTLWTDGAKSRLMEIRRIRPMKLAVIFWWPGCGMNAPAPRRN